MSVPLGITHVTFNTGTGASYRFRILHGQDAVPTTPGLYAFVKIATVGIGLAPPRIDVGRIGKALNLRDRLSGHEAGPEARRWGMTHIAVLEWPLSTDDERARVEALLIQHYNPPLNTHHTGELLTD